MKFSVKRYWEVCDSVDVEANSPSEAIDTAHELPVDSATAEFVPDSMNSDPFNDVQPAITESVVKRYEGRREGYVVIVTVDGRRLNPRLDLYNHSPTGFEWGYGGSGPAQLALAILADHCRNDKQAFNFHHRFKWAVIAELPRRHWTLSGQEIDQVLQTLREMEPLLEGVA